MVVDPKKLSKIATVQAEASRDTARRGGMLSICVDLQGGVDKTIKLITEAASEGAELIGFPELFIPGYPWSTWTLGTAENAELMHEYMSNSLVATSNDMDRIRLACKEGNISAVLGYSERDGASLYISQTTIGSDGEVLMHRRKIKPTGQERVIFGDGQGDSLMNVVDTPVGKVGAMCCAEHIGPLARYHEYALGVQIHVAAWPTVSSAPCILICLYHKSSQTVVYSCKFPPQHGGAHYSFCGEAAQNFTRCLSMEGQCYSMVATQVMSVEGAKKMLVYGHPLIEAPSDGYAVIYGPDGARLTEQAEHGVERIFYADIALHIIDYSKHISDRVGHYSRPDLHWLGVNLNPNPYVRYVEQQPVGGRLPDQLSRFNPLPRSIEARRLEKETPLRKLQNGQTSVNGLSEPSS